jgi:hypothetical protein
MKERLYLDNCSFNRPYDDQLLLKNYLESEAKLYIQKEILNGTYELVWSYIMDYEISFNPFSDRKNQITKWKKIAKIDIDVSEDIVNEHPRRRGTNKESGGALNQTLRIKQMK